MARKKKEESFDQLLKRLDQIVANLESGDLPLEESLILFKDGVDIVKTGATRLTEMEGKVELLLNDVQGDETRPFDVLEKKEPEDDDEF